MMKLVLALFATLLCFEAFSQPIDMYKTFGGAHFIRDTIYLTTRDVRDILSVDPQASREFRIASRDYNMSGLFGFAGAIMLAAPLITAASGGDPNWMLAGGGAALLGGSIPFSRGFKRHAQIAVDGYNQRQEQQDRTKVYFTGNGLTLKF